MNGWKRSAAEQATQTQSRCRATKDRSCRLASPLTKADRRCELEPYSACYWAALQQVASRQHRTHVRNEAQADLCEPVQISLAVPPPLKQQLVADHDTIKNESKLVPLPRRPCVEEILTSYAKSKQKRGDVDADAEQVSNGLRTYFDRCLALVREHCMANVNIVCYMCLSCCPAGAAL